MKKINQKNRRLLFKACAGFLAVLCSPFISSGISKKTEKFSLVMNSEVRLNENKVDSEPLLMNSSELLLYKPSENHSFITERLPPLVLPNFEENEAEPINEEEAINVISQNITNANEDLSEFNSKSGEIVKVSFPPNGGANFINLELAGQIRNATDIPNEVIIEEITKKPEFKMRMDGEPEVLIIHTHTSESYQPTESEFYDANYTGRTIDSDKNVIAIGAEIAKSIAGFGITVIHDGTIHDNPYSGAYERSAETVKAILKKYPSVKIVFDVHRDAISEPDGSLISAVTEIDGEEAAQIMFISAADDGTYGIPEFMKNLRFAALLQEQIEHDTPGITRPVLFQYCQYNQQLSTGSLLIEVGSNGNTIEQAKLSGKIIGESIGKALANL